MEPNIILSRLKQSKPLGTRHNYYSPVYGARAAEVINAWAKQNFATQVINCASLDVQPPTLQAQLNYGMAWLIDNLENEKDRNFFKEVRDSSQFKVNGGTLELHRIRTLVPFMQTKRACNPDDLLLSLRSWIASDPPLNAKWPSKSLTLDLRPDEVEQFQALLDEHKHHYIGRVQANDLRFIRYNSAIEDDRP